MNKYQNELLEKCKHTKLNDKLPLFDDIYILPTTKKHDSGYKIMYIVGLSREEAQYYLLDTYCDVVNLGDLVKQIQEINIDIYENGIIHLWSNREKFKSNFRVSSCTFDLVNMKTYFDKEQI